jgi:aryl-alcohol dehydrogenase-like predicted oxidoreductase
MANDFLLGDDLRVHRLGLGAMRLALGGRIQDPMDGIALLRRAAEIGVNHIDTAASYGSDALHAHDMIRRAFRRYPADLVIATKVGAMLEHGDPTTAQRRLIEHDLRRLGRDHLDLVYLRTDGMGRQPGGEPIGERFAALAQLRDEGLVRHLGVSHVDADQLAEALSIAPVAAVQNRYGAAGPDDPVLARCEQQGIAYVPFFPLGGGRPRSDQATLANVAARHGATVTQVALAWLLAASPVTLAIPGTSSLDHLTENVAAAGLHLTADDLAELQAAALPG